MQPDTLIPDLSNPQSWNRYSYVTNRPVNFNDPTGHVMSQGDGGGNDSVDCKKYPQYCNDGTPKSADELLKMRNKKGGDPPESSIEHQFSSDYCEQSALTCWANFSQDVATTIDFIFAGVEVVLVVEGCLVGPEGCAGGLLASWLVWNFGPNQLEASLSGVSLALTALDDYLDDQEFGESTSASLTTFLVGGVSPDPIADLIIDGYASGYNHGFFNSINSILNGADLMKDEAIYK